MEKRKQILITALQDKDAQVRKCAADALEKLEIRERLDVIGEKIEKSEMLDKIRAVYALMDLKGDAINALLVKALKDPSEDVRAAAIRVLAGKGDSALKPLVEMLKDESPIVVRVAVEELADYEDTRLLGPFMSVLKNPDTGVVERALDAISRLGDKRAEDAMCHFAVKGNTRMRSLALKALGEMDI
jgi:HEAT repeat protein